MTPDSMIVSWFLSGLVNHMWQTTLFVGFMAGLILTLRRHHAGLRHAMWCIASVKFLVPFSLLVAMGRAMEWPASRSLEIPALNAIAFPTAIPVAVDAQTPQALTLVAVFGGLVWMSGCAAVIFGWLRTWRRTRKAIRSATPLTDKLPSTRIRIADVRRSRNVTTPAVFGVLRPTLIVPVDIEARLSPTEWAAVVSHELAHVQRRDNLTMAFHMVTAAIFWFHPFVWWIRRQLIRERERACDEAALAQGFEPHVFAEGLLKICRSAVGAPAGCVAGVYSADLKQRIGGIMNYPRMKRLHPGLGLAIGLLTVTAILGPVTLGLSEPTPGPGPFAPGIQRAEAFPETWLEDVDVIIEEAERGAFESLQTDEERFRFIEEFWMRRDPTPNTVRNEFQEELYRRIAFSNERFGATVSGSQTDRGRIYISFGPPDQIESRPGGETGVPSEQWHYRLIEGIGREVVLGFVDPDGSDEYRLATDPEEMRQ